jgi:hypothetical protein
MGSAIQIWLEPTIWLNVGIKNQLLNFEKL